MTESSTTGSTATRLNPSLRRRHVTMIAIGGSIGTGLFVGSGSVLKTAGPAAVLSYAIAGVLVLFTLRMLGEMVVANPAQGSFADHAADAFGPRARFVLGWLYWYQYVIVVAAEAAAGAAILSGWIPVPQWVLSLALLVVMTVVNLVSVRSFGESEFFLSSVKVAAIGVFIVVCALYVLGWWPGHHGGGAGGLTAHGGFLPNGVVALFSAIVVVTFSFGGTEIAALAAAESAEPERAVARATTGVVWRVALFYILSILLVVLVLPWDDARVLQSPYVAALNRIGIPAAGDVMNVVILIGVVSVLNSALYASSRMLHTLTRHGAAPRNLVTLTRRRVPVRAILLGTVVGYVSVIVSYVSPEAVFTFLLNSAGITIVFVWLFIAATQLRLRARYRRREPERLRFPMWGYPYLTIVTIAALVVVLVSTAFIPEVRPQLIASLVALAVVALASLAYKRPGGAADDEDAHVRRTR